VAKLDALFPAPCAASGDRRCDRRWDRVLIENQPSLINPKMKSVQAVIHAFFALRHPDSVVAYVAASSKIRASQRLFAQQKPDEKLTIEAQPTVTIEAQPTVTIEAQPTVTIEAQPPATKGRKAAKAPKPKPPPRLSYKDGKRLVIDATAAVLGSWGLTAELAHMRGHKKKDDLCDAFVQGAEALGLLAGLSFQSNAASTKEMNSNIPLF
jgi:hypothetical protein